MFGRMFGFRGEVVGFGRAGGFHLDQSDSSDGGRRGLGGGVDSLDILSAAEREGDGGDHGGEQDDGGELKGISVFGVDDAPQRAGVFGVGEGGGEGGGFVFGRKGVERGEHFHAQQGEGGEGEGDPAPESLAESVQIDVQHHQDEEKQDHDGADIDENEGESQEFGQQEHPDSGHGKEGGDQKNGGVDGISRQRDGQPAGEQGCGESVKRDGLKRSHFCDALLAAFYHPCGRIPESRENYFSGNLRNFAAGGIFYIIVRERIAMENTPAPAAEPAPHVRFANVLKSYDGETVVVRGLNLDIRDGEFLTMLGPSGSGKTTCLMMLAGFETATRGEIYMRDKPINNIPPHKRGMGMVFQNYALFPHMSVRENLLFPLQVRREPEAEAAKKVARAMDMVRLSGFEDRRPGQLSGGQQQRVAVARALVFQPDLVLMDEPLGALDKNLREQMQFELKHIHENVGATFVYVTHDQSEALTMSDRIAVFNDGVIQQLAGPDELYERPCNAFVANFIGENNRLRGRVKESDGDGFCRAEVPEFGEIRARQVNADPGENTILSIRPERVMVEPDESMDLPNRFEARVLELIYLGDHIRVRLSLLGDDEFVVKIQNARGRENDKRLRSLHEVGGKVQVGWRAEDCRALDCPK